MVKLLDLDGNGALDLVILDGGTDHPIHVRFATDEKKLGPEQRFQVEVPRAIAFGQIDGKGGQEILTIENQSGRGRVLTLDESATDEQNKWGRLIFFGLPQGSDRGRSLAVGDLDGDKRKDIVVTDPANAQVWLYRQGGRSGLSAGQSFPGLLGGRIRSPGRSGPRRQGRGLRPLRAGEADRPQHHGEGARELPDARCRSPASPWPWTWPTSTATRRPSCSTSPRARRQAAPTRSICGP